MGYRRGGGWRSVGGEGGERGGLVEEQVEEREGVEVEEEREREVEERVEVEGEWGWGAR